MLDILTKKEGFTLSELLVAMVISGVVMAAMYSSYYSQQKSYVVQEQVAAMQQNLRAAMFYMEKEIRMAGCDSERSADAGITTANASSISFTEDIRGAAEGSNPDGDTNDPNESITYSLSAGDLWRDDVNGIGNQTIAENIDALSFVYLDGASPPTVLDDDGSGNVTTSISDIRSVQITVVARTDRDDPQDKYTDTSSYRNQQGTVILAAQNDHFRRRLLTTTIRCRNLGL
jgi:type IV pilus assembly protein PilW